MHESMMTDDELTTLRNDIEKFYEVQGTCNVTLEDATKHFEDLGYELTRPIEHTLQAYGYVKRPDVPRIKWPYPMVSAPWRVENDQLVAA